MEAQETKAIKREVKKARIYEFRRLARRIQQLQHKKGTPAQIEKNKRKAERIHNQMEYLKKCYGGRASRNDLKDYSEMCRIRET